MDNLKKLLEDIGEEAVSKVVSRLLQADKKATGELINSVGYEVVEAAGELILNILAADHFQFVDAGRRPGKRPPIRAIMPWISARGIVLRNKKGKVIPIKSAAFIISKSIGERGIKALNIKREISDFIISKKEEIGVMTEKDIVVKINEFIKNK